MKYSSITILIIGILIGCNTINSEINKAFKTVSESIDNSNAFKEKKTLEIYNRIDETVQGDVNLKLLADTIFSSSNTTITFIDSLKRLISHIDTTGIDTKHASDLMVNSTLGSEFEHKIDSIYEALSGATVSSLRKDSISIVFKSVVNTKDSNWRDIYFKGAPTSSVITTLNKFKSDCLEATVLALSDIEDRLKN